MNLLILWLFNLANLCDIITTGIGLRIGLHEVNPIINFGLHHVGFEITMLLKLIFGATMSRSLYLRGSYKTLLIFTIILWTVVASNIANLRLLYQLIELSK